MIPNAENRNVQSGGVSAQSTFGISKNDTAHIMGILRDTLYTDSILAVLREYASNAWDANREVGRGKTPIRIHIPTTDEPTLIIRDYGPGLSDEDVLTLYTQYGASTKRNSNDIVGNFGIGCKAAFAYSDTFTVTSWHRGRKCIYVAALDNSDCGVMQRLHEEPCPKNETGVEVKVAIKPQDQPEFHRKARDLFSYFIPRPDINIELKPERTVAAQLKSGSIYEDKGDWVALMGCVPYRVNIKQLRSIDGVDGVWQPLTNMSGILNFNIGDVEISASREELKYTEKTNKALLKKFELLLEEYVQHALKILDNKTIDPWSKRLRLSGLKKLGFPPLEDKNGEWQLGSVSLIEKFEEGKEVEPTYTIWRGASQVSKVYVASNTRLVIQDDRRRIKGYQLENLDYLIKPRAKISIKTVEKKLKRVIKDANATGIPIINISTLSYTKYISSSSYYYNKKHHLSLFRLVGTHNYRGATKSNNWEAVKRTPTEDDIFVLINRFESIGCNIFSLYRKDMELIEAFNLKMPEVYGYKSTKRRPVRKESCLGTHYVTWRKKFFKKKLLTPSMRRNIANYHWSELLEDRQWNTSSYYSRPQLFSGKTIQERATKIHKHLEILLESTTHPIIKLFDRQVKAVIALSKIDKKIRNTLPELASRFSEEEKSEARLALKKIREKYPLLTRYAKVKALWTPDNHWNRTSPTFEIAKEWARYIKTVDMVNQKEERKENESTTNSTKLHNYQQQHQYCMGRKILHGPVI